MGMGQREVNQYQWAQYSVLKWVTVLNEESCGALELYEGLLWVTVRGGSRQVCCTVYDSSASRVCIIQVLTKNRVILSCSGQVHEG